MEHSTARLLQVTYALLSIWISFKLDNIILNPSDKDTDYQQLKAGELMHQHRFYPLKSDNGLTIHINIHKT